MVLIAVTLLLAAGPSPEPARAPSGIPDAEALLRDSDRARGAFPEGVSWALELESTEEGATRRRSFLVRARGVDALAEATAPARNKGELYLFNDRSLWFVKPGLRRPISISGRQRLQGDAANGDVASTNYARDYEGQVLGEEEVAGEAAWRLELKARRPDVTYDRIRYWVSKRRRVGLRAEFLTVGGECFKTAVFEYQNLVTLEGKELPMVSRMTIRDVMGGGGVTVLRYGAPRTERLPASMFNINNVAR
jgi:hypothetical protein